MQVQWYILNRGGANIFYVPHSKFVFFSPTHKIFLSHKKLIMYLYFTSVNDVLGRNPLVFLDAYLLILYS